MIEIHPDPKLYRIDKWNLHGFEEALYRVGIDPDADHFQWGKYSVALAGDSETVGTILGKIVAGGLVCKILVNGAGF